MDNIKDRIDTELDMVKMNDDMKSKIRKNALQTKPNKTLKWIAACIAFFMIGGTTVFAGYYVTNKNNVNETELPELDDMRIVEVNQLPYEADEDGFIEKDVKDYQSIQEALGIHLLNSGLSTDNPYMMAHLDTDNKDYVSVTVENYILGDTSGYHYLSEENRYDYKMGKEYQSPISLTADMILSEKQLETGWNTDYLGMYRFVEQYSSKNGYKVNIVETTGAEGFSKKCAIFVADGIRYTVKGNVSLNTMKETVATFE